MTVQPSITIKTFSNGDVLSCRPANGGVGELAINGKYASYQPLITPKAHPSGAKVHAVLTSLGKQYALTQLDIDAILAANAHYVPTMVDRMSKIWQFEDIARNRRLEVGSARAAAVETMRVEGVGYDTAAAHQAELDALAAAEAELEAAKQADPEAWAAVQADRAEAIDAKSND